jgi:hypothetical protein
MDTPPITIPIKYMAKSLKNGITKIPYIKLKIKNIPVIAAHRDKAFPDGMNRFKPSIMGGAYISIKNAKISSRPLSTYGEISINARDFRYLQNISSFLLLHRSRRDRLGRAVHKAFRVLRGIILD